MNTKLWILSLCLFCGMEIFPQNENDSIEETFGTPFDNPPMFRKRNDSFQALMDFISRHLRYPATAWEDSVEGRVIINFWIEKSGETDNHQIVRGIREDLDNEALRVARLLKFEEPAMLRGKPMRVKFTLPIVFDRKRTKSVVAGDADTMEDSIRAKAEEFIIAHSDRDFFGSLFELEIVQVNKNQAQFSCFSIDYRIRTDFEKKFYYRQLQDKKTITSNGINIRFNEQQEITGYPDIGKIYRGFLAYRNTALLSEEEIKELSDSFSKSKNLEIRDIKYIYDLDMEQFYLEVIRQDYYDPLFKEMQQIDIQNKALIKKEGSSFFRMFGYYLGKIFR